MTRNKKISSVVIFAVLFVVFAAFAAFAGFISPATCKPDSAVFDKNNPADVVFTIDNATEVKGITFFGGVKVKEYKYKFDGNTHKLTFLKDALNSIGNYYGTVMTDNGNVSAYLQIIDTTEGAVQIKETGIQIFDKAHPDDIVYHISNAKGIDEVRYNIGEVLNDQKLKTEDYVYDPVAETLTIKKEVLAEGKNAVYDIEIKTNNTINPGYYSNGTPRQYASIDTCIIITDSRPGSPVIEAELKGKLEGKEVDTDAEVGVGQTSDVTNTEKFKADDVRVSDDGMVYIKDKVATDILIKAATTTKEYVLDVQPLPIFKVSLEKGKIAAISLKRKGEDLKKLFETVEEIDLRKLTSKTGVLKFTRITDIDSVKDGTFIVLDSNGKIASGNIDNKIVYEIITFVQDNEGFDIDDTPGVIVDPAVLAKIETKKTPAPSNDGSGGGCNAGFGMLALLCTVPVFLNRKRLNNLP